MNVPKQKIAVNARTLRKGEMDGIGWVTYHVLKRIVPAHPEIEFHFFFDCGIEQSFLFAPNIVPHNLVPPAKHALLNIVWFEFLVPARLKKIKADLFFSPDGLLTTRWKGKQYGIIHDINYRHIPQDLKWTNDKYYNYYFPKYAAIADRIGTVSEYSKQDIVNNFRVPPEKIDVVSCGVDGNIFRPVSEAEKTKVRQRFADGQRYFCFIGTLHPRKNIVRLMQAFDLFKATTGDPIKLLIAGKGMYKVDEIKAAHQNLASRSDIVFLGRMPEEDLNPFLAASSGLVFVPYFEGFGLPILEAMQCHVPVISSNVTSMPEVAGDAALLVDPYDVKEIALAMQRLNADPGLAATLVQKGIEQKDRFTWNRTAAKVWDGISRIL